MFRLATLDDTPALVDAMYKLKDQSQWAAVEEHAPTAQLTDWIRERLSSPRSVCYVWDDGRDDISAFCGASLSQFYLPPHMPTVFEWGWYGSPKRAVQCWRACCAWGKKHGAEWAGRVSGKVGTDPRRVIEAITWEKL
jgi:hypothetical protein